LKKEKTAATSTAPDAKALAKRLNDQIERLPFSMLNQGDLGEEKPSQNKILPTKSTQLQASARPVLSSYETERYLSPQTRTRVENGPSHFKDSDLLQGTTLQRESHPLGLSQFIEPIKTEEEKEKEEKSKKNRLQPKGR